MSLFAGQNKHLGEKIQRASIIMKDNFLAIYIFINTNTWTCKISNWNFQLQQIMALPVLKFVANLQLETPPSNFWYINNTNTPICSILNKFKLFVEGYLKLTKVSLVWFVYCSNSLPSLTTMCHSYPMDIIHTISNICPGTIKNKNVSTFKFSMFSFYQYHFHGSGSGVCGARWFVRWSCCLHSGRS